MDTPLITGLSPSPPAEPDSPDNTCSNEICGVLQFIGDEQYYDDPDLQRLYRSLFVDAIEFKGIRPEGLRLPAMTFGVPFTHETLARMAIPEHLHGYYQGMIHTGDASDVCTVSEIEDGFFPTLNRLKNADEKNQVRQFEIGNHEVFHAGNLNSGENLLGVVALLLNIEWYHNYQPDVWASEAGGDENILGKEKLIKLIYNYFYNKDPDPKVLLTGVRHLSEDPSYLLKGENKRKSWNDSSQVFTDFWEPAISSPWEKPTRWNALVQYKPDKDKHPEQEWLYTSAMKMADLNGHPVYFINLDTMDYIKQSTFSGALFGGYVSNEQVRIINAFMDQMRSLHPGVKFILGGHFPLTSIKKIKKSGLGEEILSDDDVIAYIGAHTHKRGFEDLNTPQHADKLGIYGRKTSLPMIVAPGVMDFPNESLVLKYGVADPATDKLYFEFTFTGIDPSKVPGVTDDVKAELTSITPHLNSFEKAKTHIIDPELRELANPLTPYFRRIWLTEKLVNKPDTDTFIALVVAQDVIPTMVQGNILYKRLFASEIKLALIEAGFRDEAEAFQKAYLDYLEQLNRFYESFSCTVGRKRGPKYECHQTDGQNEASVTFETRDNALVNEIKWLDVLQTQHPEEQRLSSIASVARLMRDDLNYFKDWLNNYWLVLNTASSDEEFKNATDLFGNRNFRDIEQFLWSLPYGSQAAAFATLAHLESARLYEEYRFGPITKKTADSNTDNKPTRIADQIRLEVLGDKGDINITKCDLSGSSVEDPVPKTDSTPPPSPKWTWVSSTTPSVGLYGGYDQATFNPNSSREAVTSGHIGGSLSYNYRLQVVGEKFPLAVKFGLGGGINGEITNIGRQKDYNDYIIEVPIKPTVGVGDRYGIVGASIMGIVGPSIRWHDETPYGAILYGGGLRSNFDILDRYPWVEYGREWTWSPSMHSAGWYLMIGGDIPRDWFKKVAKDILGISPRKEVQ